MVRVVFQYDNMSCQRGADLLLNWQFSRKNVNIINLRDGILLPKINEGICKIQNVPAVAVPLELLAS